MLFTSVKIGGLLLLLGHLWHSYGELNYYHQLHKKPDCPLVCLSKPIETVNLIADVGFFSFIFGQGNAGNFAKQAFFFNLPYRTRFLITDCLCGGDSFIAIDQATNQQFNALQTCQKDDKSCKYFSYDPAECAFSNVGWCHSNWIWLNEGPHNITIDIVTTPFQCGTGYVILQTICQDPSGFFYVCCEQEGNCIYSIYQ